MRRTQYLLPVVALLVATATVMVVRARPTVPVRQIPSSVLAELRLLENRFELALLQDCAPERCFSKGCTYGEHAVADRPRTSSLPGLGEERGPGSVSAQEYLTRVRCSFAHERTVSSRDIQALVRRLQAKLSKGWTVVEVTHEVMQPISPRLRESPEPEPPAPEPEPEPPAPEPEPEREETPREFDLSVALRELWVSLLPHFSWMIALILGTLAALVMIWGWRRLGRESAEEQALIAQMLGGSTPEPSLEPKQPPPTAGDGEPDGSALAAPREERDASFVAEQRVTWGERFERAAEEPGDEGMRRVIGELLKSREMELLAKAMLLFPQALPRAFPAGDQHATAKLELADHIKALDPDTLPSEEDFFAKLNRHALSASLAAQPDAEIVKSLREEFGAASLADLVHTLPPRHGALLFAFAPTHVQLEVARMLSPRRVSEAAAQLLLSNRMDPKEGAYLFGVLAAVRADEPLQEPPETPVSDRGAEYDAAGALSVLLPFVDPAARADLLGSSLDRFGGTVPAWYGGIVFADMLQKLTDGVRADLLLEVDVQSLAAWLSVQPSGAKERVLAGMPASLQVAIDAASTFPSRAVQLSLGQRGRRELAEALQRKLAQSHVPFESLMA